MFKNVMDMSLEELVLHTKITKMINLMPKHQAQRAEQLQCDPYEGYNDCGCGDDEEEDLHYVIL
jgi:hypothetical protein